MATGCGGKGRGPEKLQNTFKRMTPPHPPQELKVSRAGRLPSAGGGCLVLAQLRGPFCSTLSRPLEGCLRQGQGQGRGAERGHLHAGLGCRATWGRLPSLGAWQRAAALAACGRGSGCLRQAGRPVQSILTFLCAVQRGSSPRTARAVENGVAEHPLFWTQAEFN